MSGLIDDAALPGAIERYLAGQLGHAVKVGALRRFAVGFSWLTYAVPISGLRAGEGGVVASELGESRDAPTTTELILRLGPDYGLYAPYSAAPQALAMHTLKSSAVPTPQAFWYSDDASILGAPFLFCEKLSGAAVVPWVSAGAPALDGAYRDGLAQQFIDTLAALHRVDWRGQPISAMATAQGGAQGVTADNTPAITAENAALLNVQYWRAQIQRWAMRPYPLAEFGLRWLQAHAPRAPFVAIVHGDYRTGNFLEQDGQITAILDWELVHLGDPHEDLGWASLPMYMGGSKLICRLAAPDAFYARYAQQAGFDVDLASVRYYQVLALLKLAATHMAAARRFEEGRFNDMRMPAMGSQIAACLKQMERLIP